MSDKKITVAIITARTHEDTSYDRWFTLRNAFLDGHAEWTDPVTGVSIKLDATSKRHLTGELGALLTACLADAAAYHAEYQIRALALQTHEPDDIIVVTRTHSPDVTEVAGQEVTYIEPMVSAKELERNPLSGLLVHPGFEKLGKRRMRDVGLGCADKNTALLFCQTDYILVLDDCCLPGPGVVQAAWEACEDGCVYLPTHRQLFLPTEERPYLEHADSNTGAEGHHVMGVCGGPLQYFLDINGWNTDLDLQRGGLDMELKARMDRYLKMREQSYSYKPHTRIYELEHTYPWIDTNPGRDWQDFSPSGYLAPGPKLKEIRKQLHKGWPSDWKETDLFEKAFDMLDEAIDDRITEIVEDAEEDETDD